jgi:hypothetical protein
MDRIDLDELERVADCYEARKNSLIESGIRRDQAYLATFAQGDSVKAFEALRPLIARVRELERQREFFLKALKENSLCPTRGCFDVSEFDEWDCTAANNRECWIKAAEEAGE